MLGYGFEFIREGGHGLNSDSLLAAKIQERMKPGEKEPLKDILAVDNWQIIKVLCFNLLRIELFFLGEKRLFDSLVLFHDSLLIILN